LPLKAGHGKNIFLPELKDLLVNSCDFPTVLPGNPIHIGKGVQMCTNKAIDKILEVIDKLDEYKAKIEENYNFWLKNFSYNAVKKQLLNAVTHEMLN